MHGNFHFNLDRWVGKSLSLATEALSAANLRLSEQQPGIAIKTTGSGVKLSGVNPGFSLAVCSWDRYLISL